MNERRRRPYRLISTCLPAALLLLSFGLLAHNGCSDLARNSIDVTLPARATDAKVVQSLGNLRTGRPTSPTEARLAQFLFGVEPDAPLALIKPTDLAVLGPNLLISEGAFQAIIEWSADTRVLASLPWRDAPQSPRAMTVAANGDVLLAGEGRGVSRFSGNGAPLTHYAIPGEDARIGGIACVGDQVWVTNTPAHRVEIFDAASGRFIRSLGRRGAGRVEFGLPLGIAADGNEVFVVDMLNARVQVLSTTGAWIRNIGAPGDRVGHFGRPRSVAIGPDDTVFVTDSASQCVHAFTRDGRPLLTFGGISDGGDALALPAGIAIWTGDLPAARTPSSDFQTQYYVLVAEQIIKPGIRAYAWHEAPHQRFPDRASAVAPFAATVDNPHWRPDGCQTCHESDAGRIQPIARAEVDQLCLSCHDGQKASAEVHPIGRPAITPQTQAPEGWPLHAGQIGCLTCHDIRRHCDEPTRPATNSALVRGFSPMSPLNSCTACHIAESWRVNPHRGQLPGLRSATASCGFCHVAPPRELASQPPTFDPGLKASPTTICLSCHTMHSDPAPGGHLDAVVTDDIRASMLGAERIQSARLAGLKTTAEPQLLPLNGDRVSCSTCHNPHPEDAAVAHLFTRPFARNRSTAPADAHKALRVEHIELCRQCHPK